jgi:2-oxoglutarate ferredoxin oxidoreductase subunit alpha
VPPVEFHTNAEGFQPYLRNEKTLARAWAVPGTPGLEHRVGGIEKDSQTGNISYDPENHQRMTDVRAEKIARIAEGFAPLVPEQGNAKGPMAVVGWGSTFGAISRAVSNMREDGLDVSHIHLRHIWPLPRDLGDLLRGFDHVIVAEMNRGQLLTLVRSETLVDAEGLNKVTGLPFKISEIEARVRARLEN